MDLTFLINFIQNNLNLAYFILFLGSFFETIIPFCFFVYGEIFFLTGGILAGLGLLNIYIVSFVLIFGGILGDNFSYFLGKKYGNKFINYFENKKYFKKYINNKNILKGEKYIEKKGHYAIFLARISGPISWITPFLVGLLKYDFIKFLKYNTPGVIVGISQFIIIGYFFGNYLKIIFHYLDLFFYLIILIIFSIFLIFYFIKKYKKNIDKLVTRKRVKVEKIILSIIKILVIISIIYFINLYFIFFFSNNLNQNTFQNNQSYLKISELHLSNAFLYFEKDIKNSNKSIQIINFIIISNKSINEIFNKNYWIKNKIIGKDKLNLNDYLELVENKNPPISILYLNNNIPNLAFQDKTNSNIKREHLRLWTVGKINKSQIYLGSISKDISLDLFYYKNYLTPLHEISPNIDSSRLFLFNYFKQNNLDQNCSLENIYININNFSKSKEFEYSYFSDGKTLVCYI